MRKLTTLCLAFSGCAAIERPNAHLCVVNAYAEHIKCYNVATDYDDNGELKKSANAKFGPAKTVMDLNKGVWMSNSDWAKVKIWIHELRAAYEQRKQMNGKY